MDDVSTWMGDRTSSRPGRACFCMEFVFVTTLLKHAKLKAFGPCF